jgi:hypothetical protein
LPFILVAKDNLAFSHNHAQSAKVISIASIVSYSWV